mmetsp:Transcript_27492/g.43246  ORF Transcript_27492/g.43246 Transcript_27492/m.43246 type:complete len:504 (+) Transcript_27492:31-1542(+)
MNSNSTRADGGDTITNKRKRGEDGIFDVLGEQLGEMELLDKTDAEDASLSTLPDTLLLYIFRFVLGNDKAYTPPTAAANDERQRYIGDYCGAQLKLQLALEKTCRRFKAFLGLDTTMKLLYEHLEEYLEFDHQVETMREKLFIANGGAMIRRYQKSADNQLCLYMGGADGVRRLIDKILMTKMEHPCDPRVAHGSVGILAPSEFPENGFKLYLRGDSIAYLTEVVEQHMVYKLNNAWSAAMFRSNPPNSHPYPILGSNDIQFVDSIRSSDFGCFYSCCIYRDWHCCSRLSFDDSPKVWEWPEDDCLDDDILGAEQRQHMVRAIASQAGIVKLSGAVFDCIAAEILHFMATIVIDAFEVSKSLWCPSANVVMIANTGDWTIEIDDAIIGEEIDDASARSYLESDYIINHPPPSRLDEDGRHMCVIIPRQIKDAAVRIGMKPLLDSKSWKVSEGRTMKEEVNEALSLYGLSLDDESELEAHSDTESGWQPSNAEEAGSDSELEEW